MPASSQASSELSTASLTAVRRAFLGLSKPSRCLFFAKNSLTDISRCFAAIDSAVTARRFGCSPVSLTFGIVLCVLPFCRMFGPPEPGCSSAAGDGTLDAPFEDCVNLLAMFTATADLILPSTTTGSFPRPRWYDVSMWGRPLDTCMLDVRFREKFQDAM